MNIFVTSPDPVACAQALDDKRVIKMILETAQMLSTALVIHGHSGDGLYKPTHRNHPCTVWASENREHFTWLANHGEALVDEYQYRYGKFHKSNEIIEKCIYQSGLIPAQRAELGYPSYYQNSSMFKNEPDVFLAYRLTMLKKWSEDKRPPTWTKRGEPTWKSS